MKGIGMRERDEVGGLGCDSHLGSNRKCHSSINVCEMKLETRWKEKG